MMTVEDVQDELCNSPSDQLDYVFRINVGDETSGDLWVDIDNLEWDHNERVVKIHEEGAGQ